MAKTIPLGIQDAMFLWGERPDTMYHVGGLLTFAAPEGASPTYLRDMADEARRERVVRSPWNRRLRHPRLLASPIQSWVTDEDIDLDYHLRRSGLASPGGERELGVLVSRLHSHQLDLRRPPWEMHFIEGLEDGRFAVYVKVHHALVDGYSGMRLLVRSLSESAEEADTPLFFQREQPRRPPREDDGDGGLVADLESLQREVGRQTRSAATLAKRLVDPVLRRGTYGDLVGSLDAPRSILNRRIGRNRRFATQQYDIAQLRRIAKPSGATVNDVVLALVGGGLRTYLAEQGELPGKPLVAFMPVNVRAKDDVGGGNSIGALLASLGTDVADPVERLERVVASTRAAKAQLEGMTREAIMAYSAYLMAPSGLQLTGVPTLLGPACNVCVSNVPGPDHDLYLRGSRLEAMYPVSIPTHGMALNITVGGYAGTIGMGFVGCRDTVPHLQRLAVATGDALEALDAAVAG